MAGSQINRVRVLVWVPPAQVLHSDQLPGGQDGVAVGVGVGVVGVTGVTGVTGVGVGVTGVTGVTGVGVTGVGVGVTGSGHAGIAGYPACEHETTKNSSSLVRSWLYVAVDVLQSSLLLIEQYQVPSGGGGDVGVTGEVGVTGVTGVTGVGVGATGVTGVGVGDGETGCSDGTSKSPTITQVSVSALISEALEYCPFNE